MFNIVSLMQENRIKQQAAVLEEEKETADKIAARSFAQQYLSDLLPSVYSNLNDCGYFYDPVQRGKCPNMSIHLCVKMYFKRSLMNEYMHYQSTVM